MGRLVWVLIATIGLSNLSYAKTFCGGQSLTIEQKLSCVQGLAYFEITGPQSPPGTRQFELQFEQPVDHFSKSSPKFMQRLVLTHRNESEPVVLQTSGYLIFAVGESLLTRTFQTNQIQVEHRYFAGSVPAALDWNYLTVAQSAYDFHRVVQAMSAIYPGPWVNTGASKGGMTSVFHRRFFPNDVVGTVADVAPLSLAENDPRYVTFMEQVGGSAYQDCREDLGKLQVSLLESREEILPQITGKFQQLGGAEVAFEHAVSEMPFVFWQYGDPQDPVSGCSAIPTNGTVEEMYKFLNEHSPVPGYADDELRPFQPYFFQAAAELGYPGSGLEHLKNLLKYPLNMEMYLPAGARPTYTSSSMRDIESWVVNSAEDIIFVYGEFDPWTAAAFPVSPRVDHFVAPQGNHGAKFTSLAQPDRDAVTVKLSKWFGKNPPPKGPKIQTATTPVLEEIEFKARRLLKTR